MLEMSCHICSRAPNSRLPFYCPTCARSELYQLRIENAGVLLEKGSIESQIEHIVALGGSSRDLADHTEGSLEIKDGSSKHWAIQTMGCKQAEALARTNTLVDHIGNLKSEIKNKQVDLSRRRVKLAQRYSDAESAKYQLAEREAAILTGIQNNTKRTEHLWHALHNKTAEARIFLCREAANLYGLRQQVKKKNGEFKEAYVIGGVSIVDLREMNGKLSQPTLINLYGDIDLNTGATPAQISTSLSNIAHLLVLISHYLSLRLPAEITLPHRNHPTPTIYTPAGSYLSRDASYMGASYSQSSASSLSVLRTADTRSNPHRPRPLFIDKNLPKLAKEDPGNYALFLEGATLLAWNVSWLCRTQGLGLASDSWEEICDIGKNMWQLLVAPPAQASTLMRVFAGRDIQSKIKTSRDSPKTTIQRTKSFPMLGHYSHGTVHSFLGASEGTEFMRTWKLPTPTRVMDKLKVTLLGEMASAEWELLEKQEWDDEVQVPAQTAFERPSIAAKSRTGSEIGAEETGLSHTPSVESRQNAINEQSGASRLRGTSGWTKLKSRDKSTRE